MGLNESKGNMYEHVTHTWNTVKGACPHDCSYCYMKRFGKLNPARFDEKELGTDLGNGNFIFVGSSCDMFADGINKEWVVKTIEYCKKFDNKYLFQSKNPEGIYDFNEEYGLPENSIVCTTLETDRFFENIMLNCPTPYERSRWMSDIGGILEKHITIEPIMSFDLNLLFALIVRAGVAQVNIGADSGGNKLPEPSKGKVLQLIDMLEESEIKVVKKKNLKRLIG